jgi:hypothetical protein
MGQLSCESSERDDAYGGKLASSSLNPIVEVRCLEALIESAAANKRLKSRIVRITLRPSTISSGGGATRSSLSSLFLEFLDLLEEEGQVFLKTTHMLRVFETAPVWRVKALRIVLAEPAASL